MYLGAGFYSEGFSFIARGNGTGGISFDRNHRDWFAAQLGPQLLFNARKIAVEIDIQPAQRQRGNGVTPKGHASLYDVAHVSRLLSAQLESPLAGGAAEWWPCRASR